MNDVTGGFSMISAMQQRPRSASNFAHLSGLRRPSSWWRRRLQSTGLNVAKRSPHRGLPGMDTPGTATVMQLTLTAAEFSLALCRWTCAATHQAKSCPWFEVSANSETCCINTTNIDWNKKTLALALDALIRGL